ncbi:MAG: SAM-dependent methyltransferase [Ilumatobacteraceae bacterium]
MSTTSREFFERMYRATKDPWSFASSAYEQKRYATILNFVPEGCFRRVFEPGCSIGELTASLAQRCGSVTAIDIAEAAIETARRRCRTFRNVDLRQGSLLDDIPTGPFDLVIVSEIGYYFTKSQLVNIASKLAARIGSSGQLLAVHWTGMSTDHLLAGRDVHNILREHLPMEHFYGETLEWDDRDGFVLDIWRRPFNGKPGSP